MLIKELFVGRRAVCENIPRSRERDLLRRLEQKIEIAFGVRGNNYYNSGVDRQQDII